MSGAPAETIVLLLLLQLGQFKLSVAVLHEKLLQVLVAHSFHVLHLYLIHGLVVDSFVDSFVQLETKKLRVKLFQLLLSQVPFLLLVEAADVLMEVSVLFLDVVQAHFLKTLSELCEDVGEEDICEEKEAEAHVTDEEQCIPVVAIVGWQHDVGEVGRGEQHQHLEVRLGYALEVGVPLVLLTVYEIRQGRERKHVQENAHQVDE